MEIENYSCQRTCRPFLHGVPSAFPMHCLLLHWPVKIFFLQCTMCCLGSMFSFQPNKLRHILKFVSWYIIQHIFVPACSVGRKTWFSRKPWLSNSKFGISGLFWPILSVPKVMFLVPKMKSETSFQVFFLKEHRKNSLKNIVSPWLMTHDEKVFLRR